MLIRIAWRIGKRMAPLQLSMMIQLNHQWHSLQTYFSTMLILLCPYNSFFWLRWRRRGGCSIQKEASTDVFSPGSRWPWETGWRSTVIKIKIRRDRILIATEERKQSLLTISRMEWRKERLRMLGKWEKEPGHQKVQTYLRKNQQAPKNKSKISTQFNFIPLSMMFEKIDKKPTELGSNGRGSKDQDKRKPG